MKNYEYKFLDWDTNYFGVKSSRISLLSEIDSKQWNEIESIVFEHQFNTIDNINNNPKNNYYISKLKNIFITDINFQFTKLVARNNIDRKINFNIIRASDINDNVDVINIIDISSKVYMHSRFYNDSYLDKELTKKIYAKWIENSLGRDDKYFILAQENEKVIGYILFNFNFQNYTANIELIAVREEYQNGMIGNQMISFLNNYISENYVDYKYINVGTQSNNIQAINFYIRSGFKVKELRTIYHCWPYK